MSSAAAPAPASASASASAAASAQDMFTAFEFATLTPSLTSPPAPAAAAPGARAGLRAAAGAPKAGMLRLTNWILAGCAVMVLAAAALYYWRRKQTTAGKEKATQLDLLEKRLGEELDAVSQRQGLMEERLKKVAEHSRSVEQGLGQALESWSETTDDLASQLGAVRALRQELLDLLAEDEAGLRAHAAAPQLADHHELAQEMEMGMEAQAQAEAQQPQQ